MLKFGISFRRACRNCVAGGELRIWPALKLSRLSGAKQSLAGRSFVSPALAPEVAESPASTPALPDCAAGEKAGGAGILGGWRGIREKVRWSGAYATSSERTAKYTTATNRRSAGRTKNWVLALPRHRRRHEDTQIVVVSCLRYNRGRITMNAKDVALPPKHLSARELRRLSAAERDAILSAAAHHAENEYRTNRQLTQFEAFGDNDLHGESSNTQAR